MCSWPLLCIVVLVPYWLAGSTLSSLAIVCLSVCLSHFSFPDFSLQSFEIWTWNLVWICLKEIQITLEFYLAWPTFMSYCPLLKFSFPKYFLPSFEILNWNSVRNLSWQNTDQVQVLLHSLNFYMSYGPLLKFSFLDFSLPVLKKLTWNLANYFVLTYWRRLNFRWVPIFVVFVEGPTSIHDI